MLLFLLMCWLDFGWVGLGCFGRLFDFGGLIVLASCFVFGLVGCLVRFSIGFLFGRMFSTYNSVALPGNFHTIGWLDGKYLRRKIIQRRSSYGICIFLGGRVEINAGIQ